MNHSNPLCKLYVIFIIVVVIIICINTVVLLHPCSSVWLCWSWLSSSRRLWSYFTSLLLTPSLPQPVKFQGWMTFGRACRQYTFRSYNICFQLYAFWWRAFHMPVWKRRQKGSRVWNFAFLLVVFKWHHGSEGVMVVTFLLFVFRLAELVSIITQLAL